MKKLISAALMALFLLGSARADVVVVLPTPHHHRHHRRFRIYHDDRGVPHRRYY